MPVLMGIDIETYSSAPLPKCGVYRYCDAPDFEIFLFSYAFDDTMDEQVMRALHEKAADQNALLAAVKARIEEVK